MHIRERMTLSLVGGSLAAGLLALVWGYIVHQSVRDPQSFHDQGGMFISFILFPLACLAWAACTGAAYALAVRELRGFGGREPWSGWRAATAWLCALGVFLALGTCIGPQVLASWLR